jgi:hypothetical protein
VVGRDMTAVFLSTVTVTAEVSFHVMCCSLRARDGVAVYFSERNLSSLSLSPACQVQLTVEVQWKTPLF